MPSSTSSLLGGLVLLLLPLTDAHTRLECPPPRSAETGMKQGPCDAPDNPNLEAFPLTPNALNTITWLESIPHPGAPARLALSRDGDDSSDSFESCVLLDHIPHDEYSLPNFADPLSFHRQSITVYIPDVYCERCHLQLVSIMSDDAHGVPENVTCALPEAQAAGTAPAELPACPVVYHSCAPVSINGTLPRNDTEQCNTTDFEIKLEWPFAPSSSMKDEEESTSDNITRDIYQHSTYYYKGNPGMYNQSDSRLLAGGLPIVDCDNYAYCAPNTFFQEVVAVPDDAAYRALSGACAAMPFRAVEPFVLGALPSLPKNMSAVLNVTTVTACTPCAPVGQCFAEGCILRSPETGNWSGPAAPCNDFAPACEVCFPDSPCNVNNTAAAAAAADDTGVNGTTSGASGSESASSSNASTISVWKLSFRILLILGGALVTIYP